MKKVFICFTLIISMIAVMAISVGAVRQEVTANAVYGACTIDGELDDLYTYSDIMIVEDFGSFGGSGNESHLANKATGFGYLTWDENYLYSYIEVTDPTTIKTATDSASTDAIECSFDFGNICLPGTYQDTYGSEGLFIKTLPYAAYFGKNDIVKQWIDDFGYSSWVKNESDYELFTKITSTGYVIECKIPCNPDSKVIPNGFYEGYAFGYGISIMDDVDDDGARDMKMTWASNADPDTDANNMWNNSDGLDRVLLVAAPVIETVIMEAEVTAETPVAAVSASSVQTTSPQTFDNGLAVSLTMFIVACLSFAVVVKKRNGC